MPWISRFLGNLDAKCRWASAGDSNAGHGVGAARQENRNQPENQNGSCHGAWMHDQSLCAARRQTKAASQKAKQAMRKSGTCPVMEARRVKGWAGAITAWKPVPSRSMVRPSADLARRTKSPDGAVKSNERVKALDFWADASVVESASRVQCPLSAPCLRTS